MCKHESKDKLARQIADNFVAVCRIPFGEKTFEELTGLTGGGKYIREWLEEGKIREIEAGIYIVCGCHGQSITSVERDWRYTVEGAWLVLDALPESSLRKIGAAIGRSRQWVCRYLEALASIGAVNWDGCNYVAVLGADVSRIGREIDAGILSRLKREVKDASRASHRG